MEQLALFMLRDEMGMGMGWQVLMVEPPRLPLLNELYMTAGALGRELLLHFLHSKKK